VAVAEQLDPFKVVAIKRLHRANRQPDAMKRQGIALAQHPELRVRLAAGAHVILCVHLEKADRLRGGDDVAKVPWLQADRGARRKSVCTRHLEALASAAITRT